MIKSNKAITLVALVITIIILLILAGITISQLANSGLFQNVQTAKSEHENAASREEDVLKQYENAISTGEVVSDRDTVTISTEEYNRLKNQNSYSTTEHVVGTWLNGKTLYEKTILVNAPDDAVTSRHWTLVYDVSANISDVDECHIEFGKSWYNFTDSGNDAQIPVSNYIESSSTNTNDGFFMLDLYKNTNSEYKIQYLAQNYGFITNTTKFTNRKFVITIQYTKTTDTAPTV